MRSAPTTYGTIILGKIRIPAVKDDEGEGFIHVRCVLFERFNVVFFPYFSACRKDP